VKSRSSQFGNRRLRSARGVASVFLALICILAGAFHQLCDLEVDAAMFRPTALASLTKNTDTSRKVGVSGTNVVADHDDDDSFSVSTPPQMSVLALVQPSSVSFGQPQTPDSGSIAEIETPPPRYLT
jgi:hypothetical protein